jgi:hypothetical protein
MKAVLETVVETPTESHTDFMYRRSHAMAGMIGLLSSRLEIINVELKWDMLDTSMPMTNRLSAKRMRQEVLETLIKYQNEWADMQQYEDGEIGKEIHDRKIAEYTTDLESLKTFVL